MKNVNLKTLKTQITDAFLLARNQEESTIKTVLESFLDYVNKADTLLTAQPTQPTQPEEKTQEIVKNNKDEVEVPFLPYCVTFNYIRV